MIKIPLLCSLPCTSYRPLYPYSRSPYVYPPPNHPLARARALQKRPPTSFPTEPIRAVSLSHVCSGRAPEGIWWCKRLVSLVDR